MNLKILFAVLTIILSVQLACAADVAYVVPSSPDVSVIFSLSSMNVSYDIINQNQIAGTDFSGYRMILTQGTILNAGKLPLNSTSSLFIVDSTSNNIVPAVWPRSDIRASSGYGIISTSFDQSNLDFDKFSNGINGLSFNVYENLNFNYFSLRVKPSYVQAVTLNPYPSVAYSDESDVRNVFFGFSDTGSWTNETEKLFENAVVWTLGQAVQPPQDVFSNCSTDVLENSENSCELNSNASLIVEDQNSMSCSIEDSVLTYSPDPDYYGDASCSILADDGNGNVDDLFFNVSVEHVNQPPIFNWQIDNVMLYQDSELTDAFNLNDYFSDVDSNMTFSVSGNNLVNVTIEDGYVSFYPAEGWTGTENLVFSASDGLLTAYSNDVSVEVVSNDNHAPVFGELSCETNILENSQNNCELIASDDDGDSLVFSVVDQENMSCSIEDNVLSYSPDPDYHGTASCNLRVEDGISSSDTLLAVSVQEVNLAPVFAGNINDFSWNENTNMSQAFNLNDYFSDDNNLIFSVSGNNLISVIINNGIVSFAPKNNWVGTESVIFSASDGSNSASSNPVSLNVLDNNQPPIFGALNCGSVLENSNASCIVSASDAENESLSFSVVNGNNMNCVFNGNVLTYTPSLNYYGTANCLLRVSDARGHNDSMLTVNVVHVNQVPVITDYFPKNLGKVMNNTNQAFRVVVNDVDSVIGINWFVNDQKVGEGSSYTLNRVPGDYNVSAVASDGQFNVTKSWMVFVRNMNSFSCSEVGGDVCAANEICKGSILNVADSSSCCNIACVERPPAFTGLNKCENDSSSITLNIVDPANNEEFKIGENVTGSFDIMTGFTKTAKFNYEIDLYDTTTEKSVQRYKDSVSVDQNLNKRVYFSMEIPDNLDKDDNYAVYVKATEKNNQSDCSDDYVKIKTVRKDYDFVIDSVSVNPSDISCGDDMSVDVKVKNIGNNYDNGYIKIKNPSLLISSQTDSFELDSGKYIMKSFNVKLPDGAKPGDYDLKVSAIFNNKNVYSDQSLTLGECASEKTVQTSIETIKLNAINNLPVVQQEKSNNWMLILGLECVVVFFMILVVASVVVLRRNEPETFIKIERKALSGEKNIKEMGKTKNIRGNKSKRVGRRRH